MRAKFETVSLLWTVKYRVLNYTFPQYYSHMPHISVFPSQSTKYKDFPMGIPSYTIPKSQKLPERLIVSYHDSLS